MLITAVIPAFNAERFVAEAIGSVLGQTHPQVECIVVDDGYHRHSEPSLDVTQRLIAGLTPANMGGQLAPTPQSALPPEIERLKLESITRLFQERFGQPPTSFRAGRFALGSRTLAYLAELGYTVDSSVTPGLAWDYDAHLVDYRSWSTVPRWIETDAGRILELPVAIAKGSRLAPRLDGGRTLGHRIGRLALGKRARMIWLRPSFFSGATMVRYVQRSTDRLLIAMLHSVEVIPGSSPYAETQRDVQRVVDGLRDLFKHCHASGIGFCGLSDAPGLV
jgi:Glycosyl transferase family 2